jgi:hypothetical protein
MVCRMLTEIASKELKPAIQVRGLDFLRMQCKNPPTRARVVIKRRFFSFVRQLSRRRLLKRLSGGVNTP